MTYIDPPQGYLYGFPKPYTPEEGETSLEFLHRNGYPKGVEPSWVRFFNVEDYEIGST